MTKKCEHAPKVNSLVMAFVCMRDIYRKKCNNKATKFVSKYQIPVFDDHRILPDLAPCQFFLLLKDKSSLK